ncbi:MAG: hypothetical protein WD872_22015, partial [Pirellulaceae bacterium]
RRAGEAVTNGQKLWMFLATLGLVVAAAATTLGTSLLAACVAGSAGLLLGDLVGEPWLPVVMFAWGAVLGLPAGVVAAAILLQHWPATRC